MAKKKGNELTKKLDLDLSENKMVSDIQQYMPEHSEMLEFIEKELPEVTREISLFGKSQSQFMDNQLTVSHLTPRRNIRQILAECNSTLAAYREAFINCEKKQIEVEILKRDLLNESDDLKKRLIELDIAEKLNELENTKNYVSGAIRKLTNYFEQLESIKSKYGIEEFSEADFEAEEELYHISKAFQQGICAARARGGLGGAGIDEGNMIYFEELGISGALANKLVQNFFKEEDKLIKANKHPTEIYNEYLKFINEVTAFFKGSHQILATYKGMTGKITEKALLEKGDTRLLESKKKSK